MAARVVRWGNSLGVRIPKTYADALEIGEGSLVDLELRDDHLVLTPTRQSYDLTALVDAITPENRHAETDTGRPRGREEW